jgi:asparagine synthetase B (glutamine-hydrolysing)
MCGIGLVLSCHEPIHSNELISCTESTQKPNIQEISEVITPRGPDQTNIFNYNQDLTLTASLLALRGDITPQPIVSGENVLCWNGQIFGDENMFNEVHDLYNVV